MKNVKNIIFDYGNVIFMIDFKHVQQNFTNLGIKNIDRFFAHTNHHPLFNDYEKGNITTAEFRAEIRRITEIPGLTDQQIDDTWNSLLIGVPEGNHEILLKLKEKYRTFLLSNNNELHYNWIIDYLKKEYQIDSNQQFFEKDYYSHLMGMRKPNAAIFEYVLRENGLNASETLFIDDSPQHLKTATELGFQTFLMLPEDNLQKFINRSGLL